VLRKIFCPICVAGYWRSRTNEEVRQLYGELEGGEWSAACPGCTLPPGERHGTHFTGGWVGPRAGLDGRNISSPPGFDPGLSSP